MAIAPAKTRRGGIPIHKHLLIIAFVVLFAACEKPPPPQDAYRQLTRLAANGDWAAVHDRIVDFSQSQLEATMRIFMALTTAFADAEIKHELASLSSREVFAWMAESAQLEPEDLKIGFGSEILEADITFRKAILTIRNKYGQLQKVYLYYRGGKWKLHVDVNSLGLQNKAAQDPSY